MHYYWVYACCGGQRNMLVAHMWGSEKNCVELVLSLHLYMDSRDQTPTQMLRLAQRVPWLVEPS